MRTLRDGLKYWLALAVVACLPLTGRAAMFQVPTGSGAGSVTTGSVTALVPLVLSGTEMQLPQRISQLNTNFAFTNASSRDFYASNGNLYSKNLSLNHRWVHYDDFNQPMTTPGVFPDAPTGARYNVFTGGGGNTNKINLVDGKWWLGETGAVYKSVTFGTNGVYGSAAPINAWGGTFSYQRSTNNTPDGYEQNLFFILSPQVDFLPTNYLHITVGANIFRVQRELSATNIIYAQHFGGRYLAFDTNHSFTVTIISNNIICDIAGMRYVGYDESLSTTYGNIKVATWEAIGSPTNQFWGKWDSEYFGYAQNAEHWQYAGPFGMRSNGTLQQITFNDRTESRYQIKHESDLFQLYDAIAGEILFSADDTAQVVTVGGASAGTVNIIRPLIYTSGTPGTGKVLTDTDGSGTAVWQTPSGGGSTQMVAAAVGNLTVTNTIEQLGDGTTPGSHTLYGTNNNGVAFKAAISNSVPVTNVVGLVHKAYAAYIAVNCNLEQDVHITNRIAGNVIVDWLNAAQGQTLKLRLHGAAATGSDYFVTNTFPSGWLVANQSSNTAPLAVQLPVSVLDGTGAELNIRNYRLFTGATNIAGAIINTYTE